MKRTTILMIALSVVSFTFLADGTQAQSDIGGLDAKQKHPNCRDSDTCTSSSNGCAEKISGCLGEHGCANCTCGTTGCHCYCTSDGSLLNSSGFAVIFQVSPSESLSLVYDQLSWDGLIALVENGLPDGWELTVSAVPTDATKLISGEHVHDQPGATAEEILGEAAGKFGVCVDTSVENKTIVFRTCER